MKFIKKYRYNNKKFFVYLFTFVLLAGVTIGYSSLRATLKIDGVVQMDSSSWDIHFDNINSIDGSVTATTEPTISNNTSVSFSAKLDNAGDYYGFTVDVVNNGTFDAMIDSFTITPVLTDEQKNYFSYNVTYSDGVAIANKQKLAKNTTQTFKVLFKYKTQEDVDLYPEEDQSFTFNFTVNFVQADNTAIDKPASLIQLPNGRTKDNLQVGDEICVNGTTTECFNFIGYDGNNIKMLSKWNLKVGNIYNSSGTKTGEYTSSDTGYGLQSSEAKGYVDDASTSNGTVAFSGINYWYDDDESSLKSKYGLSYPADVYDTDYNDASGTNYSVAYYVENYKDILETYGLTVQSARLLTYSEATDTSIGCDGSSNSCPTSGFITNTSFWLWSAYDDICVWIVDSVGRFNFGFYGFYRFGVRPVVVISKSDI